MKWIIAPVCFVLIAIAGCSSSGPVKVGPDTYYITKTAGSGLNNGQGDKAKILQDANAFCEQQGREVLVQNAEAHHGIPFARLASAEATFKCVPRKP